MFALMRRAERLRPPIGSQAASHGNHRGMCQLSQLSIGHENMVERTRRDLVHDWLTRCIEVVNPCSGRATREKPRPKIADDTGNSHPAARAPLHHRDVRL